MPDTTTISFDGVVGYFSSQSAMVSASRKGASALSMIQLKIEPRLSLSFDLVLEVVVLVEL